MAEPDLIVRHVPDTCGGCGGGLTNAAEVTVTRRQVFDIPQPRVVVTEHQIVTVACPCG
ncbi:IS66 family transposase zinc-finger binding domain-containing protein, partial [Micromonospora sp. LOL_015]|uniref:IS66 family transposase zinc-finger binding domain-containing protein n=1 Tax=Micromonospora sp. LOL_015 TaxID=3345416 RepID=UPI003A87B8C9